MTRDDIIRMEREAGFGPAVEWPECYPPFERFANLVAEATREACAKVCDERANGENDAQWCADTIRSMN